MMYRVILILLVVCFSCSKDDEGVVDQPSELDVEIELIGESPNSDFITVYDYENFNEDLVLINDIQKDSVYLLKRDGKIYKHWSLKDNLKIGNDCVIEEDGNLLALLKPEQHGSIKFGGFAGLIQLIDTANIVQWEFTLNTSERVLHHDITRLPNGNILAMVWNKISHENVDELGFIYSIPIYTESIIEIDPLTNNIVWEWESKNHLIQDVDSSLNNFGNVSENPQLIDVNFNENSFNGDIMHANAIEYDQENDLIYLSVNFYNEVWVIDHSTTAEEIKTNSGGNYNRGGDLVYRLGNPKAYKDTLSEVLFSRNHHVNFIKDGLEGEGNLLVFVNGFDDLISRVLEIKLPVKLEHEKLPEVVWNYSDNVTYSANVSGAVRLPNGNTLITYGSQDVREVTKGGLTVWKYERPSFFWRAYPYDYNSKAIQALGEQ